MFIFLLLLFGYLLIVAMRALLFWGIPAGAKAIRRALLWARAHDNVVGRETRGSGVPRGVRVVPGDPDASLVFRSVERSSDFLMPPLGVERADPNLIEGLRDWILSLDELSPQ